MAAPDDLLALMRVHIGRDRAARVQSLAQSLGIPARHVRKLVETLRLHGYHICAHPLFGYWMGENAEDIELTCRFLRGRAMTSLAQEARLRRVALPDLIGQMKLNT